MWCDMHAFFPDCPKKKQPETHPIQPLPVPLRREKGVKSSLSPTLSEGRGRIISEIPRCT